MRTRPGLAAAYITGLTLAAFAVTAGAPRNWAVSIPDAAHTYGIRLKGVDLFFAPAVGWYIEHGFLVCIGAVVVTLTTEAAARMLGPSSRSAPDAADGEWPTLR